MENIIHADIFFFITSIAVIIFTICLVIITFYITRILSDMKRISKTMAEEGNKIVNDIDDMRRKAREEGAKVMTIADFFLNLFAHRQRMSKDRKKTKENYDRESVKN